MRGDGDMWLSHPVSQFFRVLLPDSIAPAADNLALRRRHLIREDAASQPRLRRRDRVFFV